MHSDWSQIQGQQTQTKEYWHTRDKYSSSAEIVLQPPVRVLHCFPISLTRTLFSCREHGAPRWSEEGREGDWGGHHQQPHQYHAAHGGEEAGQAHRGAFRGKEERGGGYERAPGARPERHWDEEGRSPRGGGGPGADSAVDRRWDHNDDRHTYV